MDWHIFTFFQFRIFGDLTLPYVKFGAQMFTPRVTTLTYCAHLGLRLHVFVPLVSIARGGVYTLLVSSHGGSWSSWRVDSLLLYCSKLGMKRGGQCLAAAFYP